jgi:Arc/MetJ-type ribon-helix-helix transcriptional regulator
MHPEYQKYSDRYRSPATQITVRLTERVHRMLDVIVSAEGGSTSDLMLEAVARVLDSRRNTTDEATDGTDCVFERYRTVRGEPTKPISAKLGAELYRNFTALVELEEDTVAHLATEGVGRVITARLNDPYCLESQLATRHAKEVKAMNSFLGPKEG